MFSCTELLLPPPNDLAEIPVSIPLRAGDTQIFPEITMSPRVRLRPGNLLSAEIRAPLSKLIVSAHTHVTALPRLME